MTIPNKHLSWASLNEAWINGNISTVRILFRRMNTKTLARITREALTDENISAGEHQTFRHILALTFPE